MKITFKIDFRAQWGQSIYVCGSSSVLGQWDESKAFPLPPGAGESWEGHAEMDDVKLSYKYLIKSEAEELIEWEAGDNRILSIKSAKHTNVVAQDQWRSDHEVVSSLLTSPFLNAYFKREAVSPSKGKPTSIKAGVRFQLRAPRVGKNYKIGVLGSVAALGNWDESEVVLLSDDSFPMWQVDVPIVSSETPFEYKYVIYSELEQKVVTWESRVNRYFSIRSIAKGQIHICSDENFEYPVGNWKAAGIAIPVFSLRSTSGTGVGEFTDINLLTDWSVKIGMKLIQILPVNDTTANHNWVDSYPYAAISVQALHPIYANLQAIGNLKDKQLQKEIDQERDRLNHLSAVDYEAVMSIKSRFFKASFEESFNQTSKQADYKAFYKGNQHWLDDYAVFSMLRDKYSSPDFSTWQELSIYNAKTIQDMVSPQHKSYRDVAVHFYIQYHLDKQLKEATQYARKLGVVLKGDIPIGIYRNSVDAWVAPELFNMDCQAGAPPDDFSISGQNWGFPTYNWEKMQEDGFSWWKDRLVKMSEYFDVFRIDHILGFFRIWEIPFEHVEGIMGRFNPALPIGYDEFNRRNIYFDHHRFATPYIRTHTVRQIFNNHADEVFHEYLEEYAQDCFQLKSDFDTQRKVKLHFDDLINEQSERSDFLNWMRTGLYRLLSDVLFLEAPLTDAQAFNPRIAMHSTFSYQDMDDYTKSKLDQLYNDYFYHRHNDFWRESAMRKLPALKAATDMLICGEDLGMVPASVPGVMTELSLLSLAIQRMPNDDREFWHPADTDYLSVTSTGSHDMTTLREWWQEDTESTQRFYKQIMAQSGAVPYYCEPWIAKEIIDQHLHSPSMWAIFPIQDLIAMDGSLRIDSPESERINIPANPQHYWRYRFHLTMEEMLLQDGFNGLVRQMVDQGGRSADY